MTRAPVADVFQGRGDSWGEPQEKSDCTPGVLRVPSFSGKGHRAGRGEHASLGSVLMTSALPR